MRAGKLDRQCTIQSASIGGSYGGSDPDWSNPSTVATVWAAKHFRRGSEGLERSKISSTATVVWEIRYRSGITTSMRLKDGSDYYDIAVIDESRSRDGVMFLHCIERDA